jgi:dynein heavy chain, axonemal
MFDNVSEGFTEMLREVYHQPKATASCTKKGMFETLEAYTETLDKIQKSLDDYLERKRQLFPRFYFISNDDLLEILGQAKDPEAVQKHMKKCFEGREV